jgi:hypothetical protein
MISRYALYCGAWLGCPAQLGCEGKRGCPTSFSGAATRSRHHGAGCKSSTKRRFPSIGLTVIVIGVWQNGQHDVKILGTQVGQRHPCTLVQPPADSPRVGSSSTFTSNLQDGQSAIKYVGSVPDTWRKERESKDSSRGSGIAQYGRLGYRAYQVLRFWFLSTIQPRRYGK